MHSTVNKALADSASIVTLRETKKKRPKKGEKEKRRRLVDGVLNLLDDHNEADARGNDNDDHDGASDEPPLTYESARLISADVQWYLALMSAYITAKKGVQYLTSRSGDTVRKLVIEIIIEMERNSLLVL